MEACIYYEMKYRVFSKVEKVVFRLDESAHMEEVLSRVAEYSRTPSKGVAIPELVSLRKVTMNIVDLTG